MSVQCIKKIVVFLSCFSSFLLNAYVMSSYVLRKESGDDNFFPQTVVLLGDQHDMGILNKNDDDYSRKIISRLIADGAIFLSEYSPRYNKPSNSFIQKINIELRNKKLNTIIDTDDIRKKFVSRFLSNKNYDLMMSGNLDFINNKSEGDLSKKFCKMLSKKRIFKDLEKTVQFLIEDFDEHFSSYCEEVHKGSYLAKSSFLKEFVLFLLSSANIEIMNNLSKVSSQNIAVVYFGNEHLLLRTITDNRSNRDASFSYYGIPKAARGILSLLHHDVSEIRFPYIYGFSSYGEFGFFRSCEFYSI